MHAPPGIATAPCPGDLSLPLPQSCEYARAVQLLGGEVRVARVLSGRSVTGWCQIQARRIRPLGRVSLVSRGPVWQASADSDARVRWLAGWLADTRQSPLILNADGLEPDALRGAGLWPLMTPAAVALLDLGGNEAACRTRLHPKWRNRLVRAEDGPLQVIRRDFPADPDHWLLRAERAQASQRRYRTAPAALAAAYAAANPGAAQLWTAQLEGEDVAGLLILRHGRMASYHVGHTTPTGRALHAHNLLIWNAVCWLSAQGVDTLDMGTLNTQDAAGLARFKLGTGAEAVPLGGTWLYHPALAPLARRLPALLAA